MIIGRGDCGQNDRCSGHFGEFRDNKLVLRLIEQA